MIELLIQAEQTLSLGLLDEAERLYRLAAEGDPNNAIAIVGLSQVALERGDELAALALARQALAIDPESSTAARMRDRLEEVIAWRGDPIPPETAAPTGAEAGVAAGVAAEAAGRPGPVASPGPFEHPRPSPIRGLLRRLTRRS
jgi:tetratricopeptide (TPR) repeat protein